MSLLPHFSLVKEFFLEMTSCLKDKISETCTVELGEGVTWWEKADLWLDPRLQSRLQGQQSRPGGRGSLCP